MPYVVAKPGIARGVYDTWSECWAALDGTKGERRYMQVSSREEGEAILEGRGVVLRPGSYAFTDGSGNGGVGVVLVGMTDTDPEPVTVKEIPTSVRQVFQAQVIPGLRSAETINEALGRLANVLSEMTALYVALEELPEGVETTVVHDYVGVRDWMQPHSQPPKDLVLQAVVGACRDLRDIKRLHLEFLHQPGHRSTWAGRHDLARFNKRADELATEGSSAMNTP